MFGVDLLHLDSFLNKLWINKFSSACFPARYSLQNYGRDGDKNVGKAEDLVSKTTTLYVHHAFLPISLPSLHNYDVKWPKFKSS